jgi:hypothetical protein
MSSDCPQFNLNLKTLTYADLDVNLVVKFPTKFHLIYNGVVNGKSLLLDNALHGTKQAGKLCFDLITKS